MSAATQAEMERLRKERDDHEQARTALEEELCQVILERDAALEREQTLAAHVEQCHKVMHWIEQGPDFVTAKCRRGLKLLRNRNPDADLTKRDLTKQAEALEEEANEWPADKYTECSHVRESILQSAGQLRQKSEAGE